MKLFFSPNSSGDLRSNAHQSQIIGGDADEDHSQIIGGDTVKLLGDISPPPPPGFRHPWVYDINDKNLNGSQQNLTEVNLVR